MKLCNKIKYLGHNFNIGKDQNIEGTGKLKNGKGSSVSEGAAAEGNQCHKGESGWYMSGLVQG